MKFSVIIPTYNRQGYIREAIDSVLTQSYSEYEIIIVDDGSTDNTGQEIKRHYSGNPKVRYYYKENEERGAARNFGLRKASGDYAVFFDSDDWMLPEYLQILFKAIKERSEPPMMVAAKYIFRDETGRQWNSSMQEVAEGWYGIDTFLKGNMLACNFCVAINSPELHYFVTERELSSMEDWLFLLSNLQTRKMFIVDKVGVVMREHSGRSMANNRKIIEARKKATAWALLHVRLTSIQQRELQTYSSYFYGIHEFLEGNRKLALQQALTAIKSGGLKLKFLFLLFKSLIGKKAIDRIKLYAS